MMTGTFPNEPPSEERIQLAVEDLRDASLAEISTAFGRLVYLSSLRDIASNDYSHWGLENTYGKEITQQAMERTHRELFREVSALSLRELHGQVADFLADRSDEGKTLLRNWKRDQSFNLLVPHSVEMLEVENFRINFEAILDVLLIRRRR